MRVRPGLSISILSLLACGALAGCHDSQQSGATMEAEIDAGGACGDGSAASCDGNTMQDAAPGSDCGNGIQETGEACDDGNDDPHDGCDTNCQIEAGDACPAPGACEPIAYCGDGLVQSGEACDDGSLIGMGCDDQCQVQPGYVCPAPGTSCALAPYCGDGAKNGNEQCDDGQTNAGDGCSADCQIENDWACDADGKHCYSTVVCGDRTLGTGEACDDGNTRDGDGCAGDCSAVEQGFSCPRAGFACRAVCGDGFVVSGKELCDDADTEAGDGCSARCSVEPHYGCTGQPSVCTSTPCGNGFDVDGNEACDGGDTFPFDGCSASCDQEPSCGWDVNQTTYSCSVQCGDGLRVASEGCDDGNRVAGDGCSEDCTVEEGFACEDRVLEDARPCSYDDSKSCRILPIVYRDFRGHDNAGANQCSNPRQWYPHPQFGITPAASALLKGIVKSKLGLNGKPEYAGTVSSTLDGRQALQSCTATLTDATLRGNAFAQWYVDDGINSTVASAANVSYRIDTSLELTRNDDTGDFGYYDDTFFPLDGMGFGNFYTTGHNFHFTSEARHWFTYQGGERLDFVGDDDVWIFVNGALVVDLGGIHVAFSGSIELDTLGLTVGEAYEVAIFQAERHVTTSTYNLTLSNFAQRRSVCGSICGDGHVTADEECDDGTEGIEVSPADDIFNTNTPEPGRCTLGTCTLGPH